MTHPTSQKPQSTYYSVIQQYRYLIEEVKQNPNKMDYLENPKILGLSVDENQEMSLNEIAFNFYPGLLVNNIDDLIELRSQELLNQF